MVIHMYIYHRKYQWGNSERFFQAVRAKIRFKQTRPFFEATFVGVSEFREDCLHGSLFFFLQGFSPLQAHTLDAYLYCYVIYLDYPLCEGMLTLGPRH